MVVKATLLGMRITEVPTTLAPDGRSRRRTCAPGATAGATCASCCCSARAGCSCIRARLLMLVGLVAGAWLLPGPRQVGGVVLDVHTLVYAAAAVLIGFQSIAFAVFTKVFAVTEGLLPEDPRLQRLFSIITLEVGLVVGAAFLLAGLVASIWALSSWGAHSFGTLDPSQMLRIIIPGALALALGCQIILTSFFLQRAGARAPAREHSRRRRRVRCAARPLSRQRLAARTRSSSDSMRSAAAARSATTWSALGAPLASVAAPWPVRTSSVVAPSARPSATSLAMSPTTKPAAASKPSSAAARRASAGARLAAAAGLVRVVRADVDAVELDALGAQHLGQPLVDLGQPRGVEEAAPDPALVGDHDQAEAASRPAGAGRRPRPGSARPGPDRRGSSSRRSGCRRDRAATKRRWLTPAD